MPRRSHLLLLLPAGLLLGAVEAPEPLQYWEVGGAQVQVSRIKMLAERLSKQNLLYQLHLGDQRKRDVVETAEEMDTALATLRQGNPIFGIPAPPTPELRERIEGVDAAWGPLRAMALASPYDYKRRSATVPGDRVVDPLLVRHFDGLAETLVRKAEQVSELYFEICTRNQMPDCETMRRGPSTTMLSERLVKEATFVYARIDQERNLERLGRTRAELEQAVQPNLQVEIVRQAQAPERGTAGRVVAGMRRDVTQQWRELAGQVDLLLEGSPDAFDVPRVLRSQQALVDEYQRYMISIVRFGAEQRARQALRASE